MSIKEIAVESHIEAIKMPDNLQVGLMVSEYRRKCNDNGCPFDYYGFGFGQSPFPVPGPLAEALAANAAQGHYSAAEGIPELREAVAGFNKRHFGLEVDPARIVIGPGTKDLIHVLFDIVRGGVVIPSPSWIGYSPQVRLLDKHFHVYHLKRDCGYKVRPDDLDKFLSALEGEQHILILNNPHNPTGVLYTREELEGIAEVCRRQNVLVLADEIYALSTFEFENFTSMGRVYPEGTFVTNGLSKDRSAGGYRLGHCILPERCSQELRDDFRKVAATVYTNVSTPTQYAAVTAYEPNEEIEEYFRVTRQIHRIMGTSVSRGFNEMEGVRASTPRGAFYFFADFNDLAEDLRRNGVATSNDLAHSLIAHPHHFVAVTGDACLLDPEDYGARIAVVDYDGGAAIEAFRKNPPRTEAEEAAFFKENAPRMVKGVEALRRYVASLKSN